MAIDPETAAEHFLLAALLAFLIFDLWALWKHRNTVSQRVQHWSKARRLFRWGGVILMGVLTWHLFWGFPW